MRRLLPLILLFLPFGAFAACPDPAPDMALCVEWEAPTTNEDGSAIPPTGGLALKEYRIFWSLTAGSFNVADSILVADPSLTEFTSAEGAITVPRPPGGGDVDLFIVMKAYNNNDAESRYSNSVARVLRFPAPPPGQPRILDVTIPIFVSG